MKDKMNKRKQKIERITITGKRNERDAAYQYLDDNDYQVVSSSPIRVRKYEYDMTRFKLVGERKIKNFGKKEVIEYGKA